MPFTWSTKHVADPITHDDTQEVRNNVDTLTNDMHLSPYEWIQDNSVHSLITMYVMSELRLSIDRLLDNPYCTSNRTHCTTDYSSHNGVVKASDHGWVGGSCTTYNFGLCPPWCASVHG